MVAFTDKKTTMPLYQDMHLKVSTLAPIQYLPNSVSVPLGHDLRIYISLEKNELTKGEQ